MSHYCSNHLSTIRRIAGLLVLCAGVASATTTLARERQGSFTGSQGNGGTRVVESADGQKSSSIVNKQGQTFSSRQVSRNAAGTTATLTGPQGQSATRGTTRTDTGSSTTLTSPQGKSKTVDVARQP